MFSTGKSDGQVMGIQTTKLSFTINITITGDLKLRNSSMYHRPEFVCGPGKASQDLMGEQTWLGNSMS